MTADPITICLERLTDYRQFERLCCALLSDAGYPRIEPLGGTGDGGRDAILRDDGQDGVTAFAFTVRKDWFPKLRSDSSRVAETQTRVRKLVYACTSLLSAAEKDQAFEYIRAIYGWHLEFIDLEGLRVLLVHRAYLIAHHPSIFDPRYFPVLPPNFAQDYLGQHTGLLDWLANSGENLATEIDAGCYNALGHFVGASSQAELVCYDHETLTALKELHGTIRGVWEVISDEHYIPSGWRWKFDNMERPHVNVQAILRAKKVKIVPLLELMRMALYAFAEFARR
ncbi:MAG: restriction endonuclease [Alcaligenes sp.]